MEIRITTATEKLLALKRKIRAASGGTGASKTFSIMMILTDYCQVAEEETVEVVSENAPHLKAGAMKDFQVIMKKRKYWKDSNWNKTESIYTFETGTTMKFYSFDKVGKAHGPRRDVLYLNECNYVPYDIVEQLMLRTRKTVWMDWNPSNDFWFYEEGFPDRKDVDYMGEGGSYPPLTYLDNEALSQEEVDQILALKRNPNRWKVYGLGLRGEIEGRIYKDWQVIDSIPHEARRIGRGLDFGYSNDPTAVTDIYEYNGGYILDEVVYRKGMLNSEIATVLKDEDIITVADSAEPKSIEEIKRHGITIVASEKGKDSVNQGIQLLQDQRFSITKRSANLIHEYRNYLWDTDKNGHSLNKPEHGFNHALDGVRYFFQRHLKKARDDFSGYYRDLEYSQTGSGVRS